jgi:hypothetical protein
MTRILAALALGSLALTAPAGAGEQGGQDQAHPPFRMPPQEAIAACASLSLDAACRFTFDGRAHEGTCRRGPEGQGPIACAPNRGPRPGMDPGPGQGKVDASGGEPGQPRR